MVARDTVSSNRRILEYTGRIVSNDVANRKGGRYLMELDAERTIDGSRRSNRGRYVNHSCDPNSEAVITGRSVWIKSIRKIELGEEITIDYGKHYFDQFIKSIGCRCPQCAGV